MRKLARRPVVALPEAEEEGTMSLDAFERVCRGLNTTRGRASYHTPQVTRERGRRRVLRDLGRLV